MGYSKLLSVGYGNFIMAERIVGVVSPESAPVKRLIQEARDKGSLIDATCGRRTRAVIVTDNGSVLLSALATETLANRHNGKEN